VDNFIPVQFNWGMKLKVSALYVYPVKSCAGLSLDEGEVAKTGFLHDREWMVVRENGWFVTQRQYPRMALIRPSVTDKGLVLSAPGMPDIELPIIKRADTIPVRVWDDTVPAIDQGDAVAAWLGKFLETKCRLVHMSAKRPIGKKYQVSGEEIVSFADSMPFLLVSQASLDDLNARMDQPVEMSRFRPNIVVYGGKPFQEDIWKKIRIGDVDFRAVKQCSRCEIITVDQKTAIKDIEPLETLGAYRYETRGIMFGQDLVQVNTGKVRIGDSVEIVD
jgi:uncharacterized protein